MTMKEPAVSRSWNCTDSRWARYWSVIARSESRERSISLVRQRWSSRSSGPTNASTLTVRPDSGTAPWVAVSGALIYLMRGPRNGPRTPPLGGHSFRRWSWFELHGVVDFLHGLLGEAAGALGALVQDLDDLLRLLDEMLPALADRGQRRQHVLEQHALAVEAADGGGAAAGRAGLAVRLGREDPVQVEDRTHLRIAGVGAALARGVRDHRLDLGGDLLAGVREVDGVAVGLRHLPPVRARHLRDLGQLGLRLREHGSPGVVEAARHLAGQLDVRHLVGADRDPLGLVHEDVRGLEQRVAEQPVGRRLDAELLHHLLVGRDPLEPGHRRAHGEEQVQLGVLRHQGLDEERGLLGIEPGPEPVRAHLDG